MYLIEKQTFCPQILTHMELCTKDYNTLGWVIVKQVTVNNCRRKTLVHLFKQFYFVDEREILLVEVIMTRYELMKFTQNEMMWYSFGNKEINKE